MFYQHQNSLRSDCFKTESGENLNFPSHLHGHFEFITVTKGAMTVGVGGKTYTVTKGFGILVFPNQVHFLNAQNGGSHFLCIFSPKLVQAYSGVFTTKVPVSNIFRVSDETVEKLKKCDFSSSLLSTKGILYSLCGEFDASSSYVEQSSASVGLLGEIFKYVENNFSGECSLATVSEALSYNYVYLSKYFKRLTGIAFTDYVCRFRVNEACYLLKNTDAAVIKIAYECGFESLRTFNRNFKSVTAMTPTEYREKIL